MADKISKVIIDILTRGGANAAGEINKIFKDAVSAGASQEKFEQRRALQRERLAAQSADKQKRLDQQGAQFAEKMAESRRRADERAFRDAERQHEKTIQKRIAAEQRAARAAEQAYAKLGSTISGVMSKLGSGLTTAGATLTGALTVPLTALAGISSKSAIAVGDLNNKLVSATGTISGANQKIADFRKLSADSVGVLISFAAETYSFLKPMQIGEGVIDRFTKALGRIKLTDSGLDTQEFSRNLSQLFSQNFEMQDLKQLVGRFPRAAELIAKQFGFSSSDLNTIQEGLQGMKKAGKLTLESFLEGFAESVENDPALGKLTETLGSRLAKASERLNLALAPIGSVILNIVLPALETLAPYLEAAVNWFNTLSPVIKTVAVAIGGFVAALGPVLIVAGGIISAIGSIVSGLIALGAGAGILAGLAVVAKAVGIAILALGSFFIQVVPQILAAAAVAYTIYKAWQTNFAGLKDFTLQAWEAIKSTVSAAMTFIYGVVQDVGGEVVGWWRENYPLIERTVAGVSVKIQTTVRSFLAGIQQFWETHGTRIKALVQSAWDFISTAIGAAVRFVGNLVRIGMQAINGDWDGAWKTILQTVQNVTEFLTRNISQFIDLVGKTFSALVPILFPIGEKILKFLGELAVKIVSGVVYIFATLPQRIIEIVPKLVAAGYQIGAALWQGVKDGLAKSGDIDGVKKLLAERSNVYALGSFGAGATPLPETTSTTKTEESEKEKKAREKRLKEALDNLSEYNQLKIDAEREAFEETQRILEQDLENKNLSIEQYKEKALESVKIFQQNVSALLQEGYTIAKKQSKNAQEIDNEWQKVQNSQQKLFNETAQQRDDINKRVVDSDKKAAEDRIKVLENENQRKLSLDRSSSETRLAQLKADLDKNLINEFQYAESVAAIKLRLLETEKSQLQNELSGLDKKSDKYSETTAKIAELDEKLTQQRIENAKNVEEALENATNAQDGFLEGLKRFNQGEEGFGGAPANESGVQGSDGSGTQGGGFFGGLIASMKEFFSLVEGKMPTIQEQLVGFATVIGDAFRGVANAIGDTVSNFVLYGNTGPAVMRKILASALATIAAEAAVRAIYAAGLGFLLLALGDFYGASQAFISAAVFGTIAVGAALAGRAVAGNTFSKSTSNDSFKQAAGQATGQNSGSRGEGGKIYSQYGDDASVIDIGRNTPAQTAQKQELTISFKEKSGWFSEMFQMEISKNGKTRDLIRDAAAA